MDENYLRMLLQAGQISPEEFDAQLQQSPPQQNMLAQVLQQGEMPQPRYDIAPMQANTMRVENGPDAGRVTNMDFAPQQVQQKPQQKLGERIQSADGRMGRYSQDGRSIVFEDGSTQDLHPQRSYELAKRKFEEDKNRQALAMGDLTMRRGEADLAHQTEQTEALRAQQNVRSDPNAQPFLEKKFGKPPKDMRWTPDGVAEPIPGSEAAQGKQSAVDAGQSMLDKIDAMVGKRDATGALVPSADPKKPNKAHPGFESAVGMPGLANPLGIAGFIPGTDTSDFKARLEEVQGGAFLEAFERLKGGGAISEVEGKKATSAITRMRTSQSEAEFVKAAQEFQDVVRRGIERQSGKPKAASSTLSAPPNPAQFPGKRMESPDGTIYKSDGTRWVRQ